MMSAAEYRTKAGEALALAETALERFRSDFESIAHDWTSLAVMADAQERLEAGLDT
jgi:hypothetical protein